jgi:two-component system catabolic regulation response regulator CreB
VPLVTTGEANCRNVTFVERPPLLIVEDEPGIAESLRFMLEREHFRVDQVASLEAARARLAGSPSPALVVLDLGLPDGNGLDLLRELRAGHAKTPVIVLTSRGDEVDRVVALELGADDYVTKPFSPREVVARVKAVLRRAGAAAVEAFAAPSPGGLAIDRERRRAELSGAPVALTKLEFDLLALLEARPGHVFTRAVLLDALWPDATVTDRTVDAHVKSLRLKLRQAGGDEALIETVRGVGYRLKE